MYTKQIQNIQSKIIKLNADQYSKIRMLIFYYNLISIEYLLAISVLYFEIFSRSRHLYDFPILRSRIYWLKYIATSKTETRL